MVRVKVKVRVRVKNGQLAEITECPADARNVNR